MPMERLLIQECVLKELENKPGITAWTKDTGSGGEVTERRRGTPGREVHRGKVPGNTAKHKALAVSGRGGGGKGRCRKVRQKVAQPPAWSSAHKVQD